MIAWLNLQYAALLYGTAQMVLAGADLDDIQTLSPCNWYWADEVLVDVTNDPYAPATFRE